MRSLKLLAMLVVPALVLGACGDDDSSDTATDAAPTTDSELEETDGGGIDEDALADSLGECGFLAGFATAFEEFEMPAFTGQGAVDFGEIFVPLADAAEEVADAAPDEIQDAFQTMAEGFRAAADELEGVEIDLSDPENVDPEAMAALEDIDSSFGEGFDAAGEEIDAWIQDNCADLAGEFDLDAFGG